MHSRTIDITGQRFGHLVVKEYVGRVRYNLPSWLCICDCGNTIITQGTVLRAGRTKSCGCNFPHKLTVQNFQGQKFGMLTVVEFAFVGKRGHTHFSCVCDCGNSITVPGYRLKNKGVKSCGCYNYRDYGGGKKNARSTPDNPVGARSAAYRRMQSNAKIRNLTWDFDLDTWLNIVTQMCFYCGAAPRPYMPNGKRSRYGLFLCNGLDRIDNSKGYTLDNVVPCCGICNGMKSNATQQEFIDRCRKIAKLHG